MKKIWSFKTAHFTVEWLIERDVLNTDYMDSDLADECRAKVRSGEWKCFTSTIRVVHRATKRVLSELYLGNSIYADPREFRDHFGMNGKGYGSYFSDMVREAIADARKVFPAFQKEAKAEINRQARALNCTLKTGLAQEVCHGKSTATGKTPCVSRFEQHRFRQELVLVIDLDERGWFKAHVDNQSGRTVFEFSNEDEETGWPSEEGLWLVEDGFMKHGRDAAGLLDYLLSMGIANPRATMHVEG